MARCPLGVIAVSIPRGLRAKENRFPTAVDNWPSTLRIQDKALLFNVLRWY